jgi:hypothetical protein
VYRVAVTAASVVELVTTALVVDVGVTTEVVETCRSSSRTGILGPALAVLTAGVETEGGTTTVVFDGATMGVYKVVVQLSIEANVDVLV